MKKSIKTLCLSTLLSVIAAGYISAEIIEIQDKNQYDKIINENDYVVVKFFAPWCPSCKTVTPIFKKLSDQDEFKNIVFIGIDTDIEELLPVVQEHKVRMIPKFSYIKKGELVESKNLSPKQNPKNELSNDLKKHFMQD